jgi:hypothetical protein
VFALAGTIILATCTITAADDNGALTGAAGGAVTGAVVGGPVGAVVAVKRVRSLGDRGPATCCCRTRARALCDQNDNADEQQYRR